MSGLLIKNSIIFVGICISIYVCKLINSCIVTQQVLLLVIFNRLVLFFSTYLKNKNISSLYIL